MCYKIITLQNYSTFFVVLKNKTSGVYIYNKLELGGEGVSKHLGNDLDQGEQDFGLTRLTLEMISLEFSLCRAAETLTLQFVI